MRFREHVICIFTGLKLSGSKGVHEQRRFYIHAPPPPSGGPPYITYGKNQIDRYIFSGNERWNYKGAISLLGAKIFFNDYTLRILDFMQRMWVIIIDYEYIDEVASIFKDRFGWRNNGDTIVQNIYNINEEWFQEHRRQVYGGSSINKNYNMNKSYTKRKTTKKNKNKKMMKKTKKSKKFKRFKKTNK